MTTSAEGLVTPEVARWLGDGLPEAVPPFAAEAITGGYSMLTFRLSDSAGRGWVLRLPPAGQSAGGAHDPLREARAMRALGDRSGVPVPRVRIVGAPDDPLGVCHVTDFVEGHVLSAKEQAEASLSPDAMRNATANLVDVLATMHDVDPDAVGLGDLGPSEDYNGRQLRRWRRVVAGLAESALEGVAERADRLDRLGDALAARLPADRAGRIVHADFRLGNTIVSDEGEIRAVLDWELVTRGEPLADLGTLLVYWDPPEEALLGVRAPTGARGSLGSGEVVERYAARTGRDVSDVGLYQALASWRLACLTLRTAVRFAAGATVYDTSPGVFLDTCDVWMQLTDQELRATRPRSLR
ncbi:phosphotransferase family protein [Microbacterium sp.]|uniref:phosphotransferase family protein n=1 Tax=Microbacterium sp. TaxID=51671 RepID=UPI0037C99F33